MLPWEPGLLEDPSCGTPVAKSVDDGVVLFLSYQECNSRGFPSNAGLCYLERGQVKRISHSLPHPASSSFPISDSEI